MDQSTVRLTELAAAQRTELEEMLSPTGLAKLDEAEAQLEAEVLGLEGGGRTPNATSEDTARNLPARKTSG